MALPCPTANTSHSSHGKHAYLVLCLKTFLKQKIYNALTIDFYHTHQTFFSKLCRLGSDCSGADWSRSVLFANSSWFLWQVLVQLWSWQSPKQEHLRCPNNFYQRVTMARISKIFWHDKGSRGWLSAIIIRWLANGRNWKLFLVIDHLYREPVMENRCVNTFILDKKQHDHLLNGTNPIILLSEIGKWSTAD